VVRGWEMILSLAVCSACGNEWWCDGDTVTTCPDCGSNDIYVKETTNRQPSIKL